jgi:adenylyltransferase/sulfurtransferase
VAVLHFNTHSVLTLLTRINSNVKVNIYQELLSPSNAIGILEPYDIILDCTDNAPARYLLSDTAVLLDKPLVSGAAQRYDGQLCVYNLGEDGPCYRCLFPKAPEPEFTGSCQETGILGAVTGVIGNLQALETIKLITGLHGEKQLLECLLVSDLRE